MRALMVLVALIATPAFAAVAQDRGDASRQVAATGQCAEADAHRSPDSWENKAQPAATIGERRGCSPVPPSTCAVAPSVSGTSSISGRVQNGVDNSGLLDWCVEISGAATASTLTVASPLPGAYMIAGVPAGSYLVCLVVPAGWKQTMPSWGPLCPSGNFGRSFSISDGQSAAFLNFRAVPQ